MNREDITYKKIPCAGSNCGVLIKKLGNKKRCASCSDKERIRIRDDYRFKWKNIDNN